MECQCQVCKNACRRKPGWFLPGEAEKAAETAGMTLKEFFDKYLVVDFWQKGGDGCEQTIFVLSPRYEGSFAGEVAPYSPAQGQCVFFQGDLCLIHRDKPGECRQYDHREEIENLHWKVAQAWIPHQKQIAELLGYEPVEPEDNRDYLSSLFGSMGGYL